MYSRTCPCMAHITRADDPRHVNPCKFPDYIESLGLEDPDHLSQVAYKGCLYCGGAGYTTFTEYTSAGKYPAWEECRCVEESLESFSNPHGFVGYHDRFYGHDVRNIAPYQEVTP